MSLGHITLNTFMAICTEGFLVEPNNCQSAFPSNFNEDSDVEEENNCPALWARILGQTRWTNPLGLHVTPSSLCINIILIKNYHRNM
jgi:hypothetical protein